MINLKRYTLMISAMAHVSVLIVMGIKWHTVLPETNQGESKALATYIYHEDLSKPQKIVNQLKKASLINQTQKTHHSQENQQEQLHKSQMAGNSKPISELIAMLHAAIQKQQHYPASALQMGREGSAIVGFTLFPNGIIDHLEIVKSSGTATLDEAAIAAVHDALPFKGIDKYLSMPQKYQLTVAFELT
jgi:TonB family protein